jgi:acyl-coenzyme A synthetase/AMP-(fatty) acid ligase
MADKVSLLPAALTPEVIRRLREQAPDVFCLTDDPACTIELPTVRFAQGDAPAPALWPPPVIAAGQICAQVFTSGSTGRPVPHLKTWDRVARCVHAAARQLGLLDGRHHAFVATVPPQHMYGLESSVLLPLLSGNALCAERPFYPADVCETLARVPAPRVLVSTPMHLRALLGSDMTLPATELVISATAPLAQEEARQVEERFNTRLMEIYGSTETGQLATRRTAEGALWQPWPGVRLAERDGRVWAEGGHIEQPTPLCDLLELHPDGRFLLLGRMSDVVNIAGKRSSLAYLDHQLISIRGVRDGAFFHLEDSTASRTGVTRVAAIVAASPELTAARVLDELRARVDPVFLPRPLLMVDQIPRNSTGKLPLESLRQLAASRLRARPGGE